MKKSPGALARRPSNSHRRTISSSGAPACRRQRSTWRPQAALRARLPKSCFRLHLAHNLQQRRACVPQAALHLD